VSEALSLKKYIEANLKIQTKDGKLVKLKPNEPQKRLYKVFQEHFNANKPCKIIILKARQMGFSTMTEAIISAVTMTSPHVNSLIVAHDTESTNSIYSMARRYYDNLPPEWKPMTKYNNARLLDFSNPTNDKQERQKNPGLESKIRVATAGHAGIGRGSTFQYMHLSELAFWPEEDTKTVQDQLTGLLQTLPPHGRSLLVIESTANGYNYFKALWDQAENGESDFIPLFFPWYEMPDYVLPYKNETFTVDELAEKEKYGLSNEQLMWRRYAINTLCGGDVNKFRQEYPGCPEEAFILTGTPFFNAEKVNRRIGTLNPPIARGMFSESASWYDDDQGYIELWERPILNHVYGIGCDTAGEGSDFFVAYVGDKTAGGRCVAKYRAKSDERLFVEQMFSLGLYYNYAMIAIETNFSTYCCQRLEDLGYVNLYVREQVDTYTKHIQKKFGFRTTPITRPLILDTLKEIVNEHNELIEDPTFYNECLSFAKNDKGKPEATSGAHDDCVMAMAIMQFTLPQAENVFNYENEEYTSENDYSDFINFGA
jgi:hypothetical protein